ncbi:MAG: hypothetical protein FJZ58_05675 [Chlamydiae bacterium]|nr:hypothetical protein [Chlamydiota bacterium]
MLIPVQCIVITLLWIGTKHFCEKKTCGFRTSNVFLCHQATTHPPHEELSEERKQEIEEILSQEFFFLQKGHQCYAFLSKDKRYVLKLLQADKITPPFLARIFPQLEKNRLQIQKRKERQERDFASYQMAYHELREESGLVYLHLTPESSLQGSLTLYDAIRVRHRLPIHSLCFILQHKADLFYPLLQERPLEELKPFFTAFSKLLQKRAKKGISDFDISVKDNVGVLQEKPILFDIGTLTRKEEVIPLEEAKLILQTLQTEAPELALFLQELLESKSRKESD